MLTDVQKRLLKEITESIERSYERFGYKYYDIKYFDLYEDDELNDLTSSFTVNGATHREAVEALHQLIEMGFLIREGSPHTIRLGDPQSVVKARRMRAKSTAKKRKKNRITRKGRLRGSTVR